MLLAFPTAAAAKNGPASAAWVDLNDPTADERLAFETASGLRVPSRDELAEIETTSRLRSERDALYLTAPLIFSAPFERWDTVPTGFVLNKSVLMTERFAGSSAFDQVQEELRSAESFEPAYAFARLMEALVDRMADLLEASSRDLDEASHVIFHHDGAGRVKLARETALLRRLMIRTGRTSEHMTRLHYTLVCLDRMAKYAAEHGREWISRDAAARLQMVSADIAGLISFTEALVNRIQLLQDAASGIINIGQNDVMKILTIASVAGIPPVLVVGLYGMNFKYMPEYDWAWGYPYVLLLIVITTVIPLMWFKFKDWI
jgi:magnesium transporter